MADYLSRACRLQLTTAMENFIRTAVLEIAQIFEDSLHDHQMELARKGEEIACLKVKLQRAELMLKEVTADRVKVQSLSPSLESPEGSEAHLPHTSSAAEIGLEVPGDWCVPLGSEDVNKQEDSCPSVCLKQFSVPLSLIPVKHEAFNTLDVPLPEILPTDLTEKGLPDETKHKRGRGRTSLPRNENFSSSADLQDKSRHKRGRGRPRLSEIEKLSTVPGIPNKRGPGRPRLSENKISTSADLQGKEKHTSPDGCALRRNKKFSTSAGIQDKMYKKRGRGRPGLSENAVKDVHMNIKEESWPVGGNPSTLRAGRKLKEHKNIKSKCIKKHTKTSGKVYLCSFCPKEFNTSFGLSVHNRSHKKCKGCKRIFPFPSVLRQHKATCTTYKNLIISSKAPSNDTNSENLETEHKDMALVPTSVRKGIFTCKCCLKMFRTRSHLVKHPCYVTCLICNKRVSNQIALKVHLAKMHKGVKKDIPLAKPFDDIKDNQTKFDVFEKAKRRIKHRSKGFQCMTCKKVYSSKYTAIEHVFVHTGEQPFKCTLCPLTFSQRNTLSIHRRKHHGVVARKVIKCACSKRFYAKSKYKQHESSCPKATK